MPLFALVVDSGRGPRRVFLWGWLFGSVAAACHLWWIWFLIVPVEPVTRVLLNLGVTVLFVYLGLSVGVFASVVRRLGLWTAPFVWALLEYARNIGQVAFPWNLLGSAMTPWYPFIQPAALGGVWLVSAWVVTVNVLVCRAVFPLRRPARARVGWVAGLVIAIALPLAYSATRVRDREPWFRVAIIQPNVSPLEKGDWDSRERIQADLIRLTTEASDSQPDLYVYPETATLVDVTRSSTIGHAVRRLADSLDAEILTGTPLQDIPRGTWHNGAVLIRPREDSVRQRHYKMRLVPFSEKIPYVDRFPFIARIIGTADMGNWDFGTSYNVFKWRKGTLSCLICYEAIFPELTREFTRRGSDLLVTVTNDGWFGRLPGSHQHAELAVMRTVEDGVPMVRSANNGISFIVDSYGRVLKKTPLFVQTVLHGMVPRPHGPTPYRRYGDWFIALSALVVLVAVIRKLVQRSRRRSL
ncbi:apolipoprotein N-acyltransferase [candidate division WOR-3 bacterium]|nr:apolipoprotein N-acyltransferase [candidate division WOR-3 bacterium]